MSLITRTAAGGLLSALACLGLAGNASAAPAVSPKAAASIASSETAARVDVRHRRYRSFKDDYYYDDEPAVYVVPRQPARIYRVPALPPPVVEYRRPLPYPPVTVYEPPVYGWGVAPWGAPPRPASCGKFRYWDGDGCADARVYPPYVGPRW